MNPHPQSMPNPATIASLYDSNEERSNHLRIIGQIANEVHRSVSEVEPLYEDILAHMKNTASVQDYISIMVSKRVKELLS
jgi:hypothetical protein